MVIVCPRCREHAQITEAGKKTLSCQHCGARLQARKLRVLYFSEELAEAVAFRTSLQARLSGKGKEGTAGKFSFAEPIAGKSSFAEPIAGKSSFAEAIEEESLFTGPEASKHGNKRSLTENAGKEKTCSENAGKKSKVPASRSSEATPPKKAPRIIVLGLLEAAGGKMKLEDLREKTLEKGICPEKFDKTLEKLLEAGNIYSPAPGEIKLV
ncbi:hypothetical protein [Methanosarcina sp. KYL-1]|uniref:DUF5817 domain-containing protein n=1 Tax=Methanosarcina sp. KYL-1 TaxID=2602068 RepID=UPI002100EF59|nr:hypothetical protein [Methanosarcina sp. KYL-1]